MDIVRSAACHHRMHAAGIIAAHAAEGIVVVGRRVGGEGEMMLFGFVSQDIEHAAWLHARKPP